jgi:DNA-binding response OmpR family regulator
VIGKLFIADAEGSASVPDVVKDRWDNVVWVFETSGTAALARLRLIRPVLAMINLQLPDMCGAELIDRLKKGRPHLPLIVTSNSGTEVSERVGRSLGVMAYLTKPLDPVVLNQVLGSVLREFGGVIERKVESDTVGGE